MIGPSEQLASPYRQPLLAAQGKQDISDLTLLRSQGEPWNPKWSPGRRCEHETHEKIQIPRDFTYFTDGILGCGGLISAQTSSEVTIIGFGSLLSKRSALLTTPSMQAVSSGCRVVRC